MTLQEVLSRFPDEIDREWINLVAGNIESLQKSGEVWTTGFLNPYRRKMAGEVLRSVSGIHHVTYGGYAGAERERMRIWRAGCNPERELPEIKAVRLKAAEAKNELQERADLEILSALMDLGLRRDSIGDIVWSDGPGQAACVFINGETAHVVIGKTCRIGPEDTVLEEMDQSETENLFSNAKEVTGTVASLRLDAVVSLGFGFSRSRAAAYIRDRFVQLNWRMEESPSARIKEADIISLPPKGALVVGPLQGESKKGRIRLTIKKYPQFKKG